MPKLQKDSLPVQQELTGTTKQTLLPEQKVLPGPETAPGIRLQYRSSPATGQQTVFWHKNSREPYRVGAQGLLQGDHIYTAPGAESLFRHELAHWVLGHARRAVRTETRAGIPVCLQPELEQQADRRAVALQPTEFSVAQAGPRPLDSRQPVLPGKHGNPPAPQTDPVLARYVNENQSKVFFRRPFTEYQRFLYWLNYARAEAQADLSSDLAAPGPEAALPDRQLLEAAFQQLSDAGPAIAFLFSFFSEIVAPLLGESEEDDTSSVRIQLIASSLLDLFLQEPQSLAHLAVHMAMHKPEDAPGLPFIMPFMDLAVPLVIDASSLLDVFVTFLTDRFSGELESAPDFVMSEEDFPQVCVNIATTFFPFFSREQQIQLILDLLSGQDSPEITEEVLALLPSMEAVWNQQVTPQNSESIVQALLEHGKFTIPDLPVATILSILQYQLSNQGLTLPCFQSLASEFIAQSKEVLPRLSESFPAVFSRLRAQNNDFYNLFASVSDEPVQWIRCIFHFLDSTDFLSAFSLPVLHGWILDLFDRFSMDGEILECLHALFAANFPSANAQAASEEPAAEPETADAQNLLELRVNVLNAMYAFLINNPSLDTLVRVQTALESFIQFGFPSDFSPESDLPPSEEEGQSKEELKPAKEIAQSILDSFQTFSVRKNKRTLALLSIQPRHIIPHSDIKGLIAVCFLPPALLRDNQQRCNAAWEAIDALVALLCAEGNAYNDRIRYLWELLKENKPSNQPDQESSSRPLANPALRPLVEAVIDLLANHPCNIFMGDGFENMALGNRFDYAAANSIQYVQNQDFIQQLFDWWTESLHNVGNPVSYDTEHQVWQSAVSREIRNKITFGQPGPPSPPE